MSSSASMPSGVTGTGLPSASPTPSHSKTTSRARALAMVTAMVSFDAPSGKAPTAGSLRAAAMSEVVRGATRTRTSCPRSSQIGSRDRFRRIMGLALGVACDVVQEVGAQHRAFAVIVGGAPVEARLDPAGAGDGIFGFGQEDSRQLEAKRVAFREGETVFERDRIAIGGLSHERRAIEAYRHRSLRRGKGRIGRLDLAVLADDPDAFEIVGESQTAARDARERRTAAPDEAAPLAEAPERVGRRIGVDRRRE